MSGSVDFAGKFGNRATGRESELGSKFPTCMGVVESPSPEPRGTRTLPFGSFYRKTNQERLYQAETLGICGKVSCAPTNCLLSNDLAR